MEAPFREMHEPLSKQGVSHSLTFLTMPSPIASMMIRLSPQARSSSSRFVLSFSWDVYLSCPVSTPFSFFHQLPRQWFNRNALSPRNYSFSPKFLSFSHHAHLWKPLTRQRIWNFLNTRTSSSFPRCWPRLIDHCVRPFNNETLPSFVFVINLWFYVSFSP